MNNRTSASQWDFPTEEDKDDDVKGAQTQMSGQGETKTSSASADGITGQSVVLKCILKFLKCPYINYLSIHVRRSH